MLSRDERFDSGAGLGDHHGAVADCLEAAHPFERDIAATVQVEQ